MSKTIAFACRVVVMLAFLIAIPLIALFGKSLPDVAETVWGYWKTPAQENKWADAEEAPPFSPTTISANSPKNAPFSTNLPATTPNTTLPNTQNLATIAPNAGNPTIPAAYITSPGQPQSTPAPLQPYTQQANAYNSGNNLTANNGSAPSFSNPMPVVTTPAPLYGSQPLAAPQMNTPQQPAQPVQSSAFEQISKRLQQLGATYYRLESWGNGQPLFRFQCRMAIVGSSGLTRQFEATDQDPAEAMRQVLRQIETWQQAQRAPHNVQTPNVPRY